MYPRTSTESACRFVGKQASFRAKKAAALAMLSFACANIIYAAERDPAFLPSFAPLSVRVTNVFRCFAARVCVTHPGPIYMTHETVRIWAINVAHKVMGGRVDPCINNVWPLYRHYGVY
jgi:hypothetical protein